MNGQKRSDERWCGNATTSDKSLTADSCTPLTGNRASFRTFFSAGVSDMVNGKKQDERTAPVVVVRSAKGGAGHNDEGLGSRRQSGVCQSVSSVTFGDCQQKVIKTRVKAKDPYIAPNVDSLPVALTNCKESLVECNLRAATFVRAAEEVKMAWETWP